MNKRWDKLPHDKVRIHVLNNGDPVANEQLKRDLNLKFSVQIDQGLRVHKAFNLTKTGSGNQPQPLRGYAIVKDGKIIESREDDYLGQKALDIVEKALK